MKVTLQSDTCPADSEVRPEKILIVGSVGETGRVVIQLFAKFLHIHTHTRTYTHTHMSRTMHHTRTHKTTLTNNPRGQMCPF